jgi:hypothetical protein
MSTASLDKQVAYARSALNTVLPVEGIADIALGYLKYSKSDIRQYLAHDSSSYFKTETVTNIRSNLSQINNPSFVIQVKEL